MVKHVAKAPILWHKRARRAGKATGTNRPPQPTPPHPQSLASTQDCQLSAFRRPSPPWGSGEAGRLMKSKGAGRAHRNVRVGPRTRATAPGIRGIPGAAGLPVVLETCLVRF